MEAAAKKFFSLPRFAVAGASQDPHKYGYQVLAWYQERSLPVQPVTPSRPTIMVSSTEYNTIPSPSALPHPTETSLSIITQPSVTLQILREAKEAGVPAVWLQPGSFDEESLQFAIKEFEAGVGGYGGRGVEGCKTTFSHASYAAFRPSYPSSLYNTILAYHHGSRSSCVDLGTGHGVVARYLAQSFAQIIGTDPSSGMVEQARSSSSKDAFPNVKFEVAPAETMPFIADSSVDMIVSGQAAHWFDPIPFWAEMKRIVRKDGTIALWCYKDHVFVNSPTATMITEQYAYGDDERLLGPYWEQPGRSIVQNKLRDLQPPASDWNDIQRVEYEPATNGPESGEGTMFLRRKMKLGDCENYVRTWSSFHAWQRQHPQAKRRQEGGEGDVIDEMFETIVASEPRWQTNGDWKDVDVNIEWGSGLILARQR